MASIRDVAKKAGVGVGTVSRVLNGTGYVSADTRKKIEKAIRELDYTPNELARNLFHNRTGLIGVLVPNVDHPFFSSYVQRVEETLYKEGYKTLLGNTIGKSDREQQFLEMLDRNMVDGIITACHTLDDEEYQKRKKPIVSLDRDFGADIVMVGSDHEAGGRAAAEIFLQNGCKRVLNFFGEAPHVVSNTRHSVLSTTLREHGVEVVDLVLKWNKFSHADYRELAERGYRDYRDVDGVFGTDQLVLVYMQQALRDGKRIPEDLRVVAYDGTYITGLTCPEMTSIRQDVAQLAELSANSVVDLIEERRTVPHKQIIPVKLHQGETTRPVTVPGILAE